MKGMRREDLGKLEDCVTSRADLGLITTALLLGALGRVCLRAQVMSEKPTKLSQNILHYTPRHWNRKGQAGFSNSASES